MMTHTLIPDSKIIRPESVSPVRKEFYMKITSFTISKSDVNKDNILNNNFSYKSVVNNNTSPTSEEIITATAAVLLDLYADVKDKKDEDTENEQSE